MELSWDVYERYVWGMDEFYLEFKMGKQMVLKGLGWIIIDLLDMFMLMNLISWLLYVREWLVKDLMWEQDEYVNMFEMMICMLGGLFLVYYFLIMFLQLVFILDDDFGKFGEDLYLEKVKDLVDRLMVVFDLFFGILYVSVNLKEFKGIILYVDLGVLFMVEIMILQFEFKYFVKLMGEKDFWDKVEKVIQLVDDNGVQDGLVFIFIFVIMGKFYGENIRLGSCGDLYYEYFIKQYLQINKKELIYQEMWDEVLQGVWKYLIIYMELLQFIIIGECLSGLSNEFLFKMDYFVCFMFGIIVLVVMGGLIEKEVRGLFIWIDKNEVDMQFVWEFMYMCWGMYKYMVIGFVVEIIYFNLFKELFLVLVFYQVFVEFDFDLEVEWCKDFDVKL